MKGLTDPGPGVAWKDHVLSDIAMVQVGESERGIGVQVAVLSPLTEELEGATVYLDEREARDLIGKIEAAIAIRAGR